MSTSNGSNRILWFLLTIAVAALGSLALAWGSDLSGRVTDMERRQAGIERSLGEINGKLDVLLSARGSR